MELPSERCPRCGAPTHKRRVHPDVVEDLVFALPTDASDAMIDAMVQGLRRWGLQDDPFAVAAVRDSLNRALVILQREIDYRWK